MGAAEVTAFLTALAVRDRVAASTQNRALNALLFLYREILGVELPWLDDVVRAKRPQYLPTVLTRAEVRAVLERLDGVPRLMALLLYGAGLRLLEACRLRIKAVDVKREVQDTYNRKLQAAMAGTVWLTGCTNYYTHPNGKVVTQLPYSGGRFWLRLRVFPWWRYHLMR
jgi:integrase